MLDNIRRALHGYIRRALHGYCGNDQDPGPRSLCM